MLTDLPHAVRGRVRLPSDDDFDAVRRPWNRAVDQPAAAVVEAVDDAIDILVAGPVAPLRAVQVRHLGGAPARPGDSPHGALVEPYLVYLFGAPSPDVAAHAGHLASALPTSGRKPATFLSPDETLADALPRGDRAVARHQGRS